MEKQTRQIHDELIEKCRQNDRNAQFEIYKLYFKQMYNTSLRIINDTAEAEDVMQESFLDAFRKIGDYTGKGNFGGWLRKIVVNNSLDAIKKRKPVDSFSDLNFEPEVIEDDENDDTDYKAGEIKQALKRLPEDYRVIISLFLFEGYDHEEIAQILNISYGASRTRYSRAKQKLLDILKHERTIKTFNPN